MTLPLPGTGEPSLPEAPASGDMPPEEFRRRGHEVVDWMAGYLAEVGGLPVLPQATPGEVMARLPPSAPEVGEGFDEILRDFRATILPAVTHWNHPAFFAYFATTGSGPGILGEMLAAALNVNAMVWRSSPAATELEQLATAWVRQLVGLPEAFQGVINDTASSSTLYALAAAREALLPEAVEEGLGVAPRGRVYASSEAHSSVHKAVITLGLGRGGLRKVEADGAFRMDPGALARAMAEDVARGVRPLAVVATVGTTSTTSVDPVAEVAEVAAGHGAWLHVDAAYAGPAAALSELAHHFQGWERADSVVLNPHKWLFTPVDCSILYCRRPERLAMAFSLTPEYLRTREREEGGATDLMDYGVSLGRRFRALKLWFVLRWFGAEGIRARLREHLRLAALLAGWIEDEPGWELVAPVPFSTVVFRRVEEGLSPEEEGRLNLALLERVNRSGEAFLSHTALGGRVAIRLAIGNLRTGEAHVARAWELLRAAAAEREVAASLA